MPIVIPRNGELKPPAETVTQEMRDALWAAFVGSWLDKHPEEFSQMISQPEAQSA